MEHQSPTEMSIEQQTSFALNQSIKDNFDFAPVKIQKKSYLTSKHVHRKGQKSLKKH